jgi:hypothetical protein
MFLATRQIRIGNWVPHPFGFRKGAGFDDTELNATTRITTHHPHPVAEVVSQTAGFRLSYNPK